MSIKSLSRGTSIDTEKCVELTGGNRFNLVLIASTRAKELSRNHRHAEGKGQLNAPVTALLEIQDGKIGKEYLGRVR
jgi:DNA-directed RNA polymerase subunit K/omega